jgi:hypothetical protein
MQLPQRHQARVVGPYAKTAVDTARELGADLAAVGGARGRGVLDRLADQVALGPYAA